MSKRVYPLAALASLGSAQGSSVAVPGVCLEVDYEPPEEVYGERFPEGLWVVVWAASGSDETSSVVVVNTKGRGLVTDGAHAGKRVKVKVCGVSGVVTVPWGGASCDRCLRTSLPLVWCLAVFIPRKFPNGSVALMELGSAVLEGPGEFDLPNSHMEIECEVSYGVRTDLGKVSVKSILASKGPSLPECHEEVSKFGTFFDEEDGLENSVAKFPHANVKAILEKRIGATGKYRLPRELIYVDAHRHQRFTDSWLEETIRFSTALAGLPDFPSASPEEKTQVIASALTLFCSRFPYMSDKIGTFDFESYCDNVGLTGGDDCECTAWFLYALSRGIQERKLDPNFPNADAATRHLDLFVPVCAVVNATAPEMSSASASLSTGPIPVSGKEIRSATVADPERLKHWNLQIAKTVETYHVTSFWYPKTVFKELTGVDTGYKYKHSEKLSKTLRRVYLEGTSSVYPIPDFHILRGEEDNRRLDRIRELMASGNDDYLAVLTQRNHENATTMYGLLIEVLTDLVPDHLCYLATYGGFVGVCESALGTPYEAGLKLVPIPIPEYNKKLLQEVRWLDLPNPVFDLPRGIQLPNPTRKLTFDALFSKEAIPGSFPYTPWNLLFAKSADEPVLFPSWNIWPLP